MMGRTLTRLSRFIASVSALGLAAPVARAGDVVEYYHLDAIGNVRVVTDQNKNVIERHDYLPFGEECTTGPCASNPGIGAGQPRRFTGKERDAETGLDYFGARYYGSKIGRFTTVDPYLDQSAALIDPQQWNRYAYARSNPLRYVDPDGRAVETPWDVLNIGIGIASLGANVAAGNVGGAAVDAAGIVVDVVATAVPGIPGGAGTAIKAARAVGRIDNGVGAANRTEALITVYRAQGKVAEAKVAAELVAEGKTILGSQVCCRTPQGRRVIDHLTKDAAGNVTAVEVKSGNATRSAAQRAKDTEIGAGRGRFVGKNAPTDLRGQQRAVDTIERKPIN